MNLTHHRQNYRCVVARLSESEILDILTRAVADEAGIDLNDPAVEVRIREIARALPSESPGFQATIDINVDMSDPPSSPAASEAGASATLDYLAGAICKPILSDELITGFKIGGQPVGPFKIENGEVYSNWKVASDGHAYMGGISLGVNGAALLNVCTYVDHERMPHTMRSVATLEDGRPQWEISKDGTARFGKTTHLPDGTIRHEGEYGFTIGAL